MNYEAIPVKTRYLKINEGYENLVNNIIALCENEDIVVISETPISTIEGNLVDESKYAPSILSIIITQIWCKYLWGYILGPVLKINTRTIKNLRKLPVQSRCHKEFILKQYGLKHALQPTAEAGVDLSNVPNTYVSPLPENPQQSAEKIKKLILEKSNKNVDVIIIDTDPTHKIRNTYYTTLPQSIKGIKNNTGLYGYILRSFTRKIGATPLASTKKMNVTETIHLANLAENAQRKHSDNFFETIYDMKNKFNTEHDTISEEMLDEITHIPAIIIRVP